MSCGSLVTICSKDDAIGNVHSFEIIINISVYETAIERVYKNTKKNNNLEAPVIK
jgi:hypothetical protein